MQELLARSEEPLPVVFMTAHDKVSVRERALRAGAVAFLRKPFSDKVFLNALNEALKRDRGRASCRSATTMAALVGMAGSLRAGQPPLRHPPYQLFQSQRARFPKSVIPAWFKRESRGCWYGTSRSVFVFSKLIMRWSKLIAIVSVDLFQKEKRSRNGSSGFQAITTKCFISLRSPTEHENGEIRHAGMDGWHPGAQDASGDIRVGLRYQHSMLE